VVINPVFEKLQRETNHAHSKRALELIRQSFERAEADLPGITQRILHEIVDKLENVSWEQRFSISS